MIIVWICQLIVALIGLALIGSTFVLTYLLFGKTGVWIFLVLLLLQALVARGIELLSKYPHK